MVTRVRARAAAAVLATAAVLLAGAVPATAANGTTTATGGTASTAVTSTAGAHSADTSESAVEAAQEAIQITDTSSATLEPGGTLRLSGTFTNRTATAVTKPRVVLSVRTEMLSTEDAVEKWSTDLQGTEMTAVVVAGTDLAGPVRSGRSVKFTVKVKASALGLPSAAKSFGAYGLALSVVDESAGADASVVTTVRSYVVWCPEGSRQLKLSVAAPVVSTVAATHAADGTATSTQSGELARGGRLATVLEAVRDRDVSWVVDPSVLVGAATASGVDTVQAGADTDDTTATATADPGSTATSTAADGAAGADGSGADGDAAAGADGSGADGAGQGGGETDPAPGDDAADEASDDPAAHWWNSALTGLADHDVTLLPYGDTDVGALATDRSGQTLRSASTLSSTVYTVLTGDEADADVFWPVLGRASASVVASAGAAGASRLLVSSQGLRVNDHTVENAGPVELSTSKGSATAVVSDADLSARLSALTTSYSWTDERALMASLAVSARSSGAQRNGVVLMLPRTWTPSVSAARRTFAELFDSAWVTPTAFSEIVQQTGQESTAEVRAPSTSLAEHSLTKAQVGAITDELRTLRALDAIVDGTSARLEGVIRPGLELLSTRWDGVRDRASSATETWTEDATGVSQAVSATPGGPKGLVDKQASFPVTVTNELDRPVTVTVKLKPRTGQLQAPRTVQVTLSGESTRQVNIPVNAVADGQVTVAVQLLDDAGRVMFESGTTLVSVHREWASRSFLVAGVLLGILLLVGLVRSAKRGRVRVSPESVPDPEDDVARRDDRKRTTA